VAGVKLDNNTGNTKHSERLRKTRSALWLEWNSTTTQETRNKANGEFNDVNTCKNVKLWLEWNSTTTQETRNKANGELNDVKTYEFSEITKNEGTVRRRSCTATTTTKRTTQWKDVNSVEFSETITKMRSITVSLWLELRFNNNTGVRNRRKTVLKCLFEWARHCCGELAIRWAACEIKIVGITNCRSQ
jgi:hypothetical protein